MKAAQPLFVVTNWGAAGAASLALLMLAIGAAGIAYWRVLHRKDPVSLRALVAICAVAIACAWLVPVLFSSDVYAYAAYGELARLGQNPYAHVANASNDPLLVDAVWQWGGPFPICVYGPAFVAVAKLVVVTLAPFGTLAQLEGMRAIASAAFLCCVPLAYAAFSGDSYARLRATATIGLNPVAIWCAAEGHNDALEIGRASCRERVCLYV